MSDLSKKSGVSWLRRLVEGWLPSGSPEVRLFLLLMAIGLTIRVMIMPFFGHIDFFSEHRRIHGLHEHGGWYPGSRFVTTTVERLNYAMVAPLLPEASSMFDVVDLKETTASHLEYFAFVRHRTVMRAVFLLKIPYLLFDLATALMIFRMFGGSRIGIRGAAMWLFNPVTLFAFYVFGRYEAIVIAFMVMAVWMLWERKYIWSACGFGMALWSREIMMLLLPFFLIAYWRSPFMGWMKKAGVTLILAVFALFAANVLPRMLGMESILAGGDRSLAEFSQARQILGFQIVWYFPFVSVCLMLVYHLLMVRSSDIEGAFLKTLGMFFCLLFVFTIHSVHYVAWSMGVLIMLAAMHPEVAKAWGLFCLAWIAFWLVGTDLGVFTQWLAAPFSLWVVNLPTLPYVIERYVLKSLAFDWNMVIGAMRSVYAGALLICFWKVLRSDKAVDSSGMKGVQS